MKLPFVRGRKTFVPDQGKKAVKGTEDCHNLSVFGWFVD